MKTSLDFRPVVIIGAARSGTNLLRDTLAKMPGYVTWPCDELPSTWRHDNLNHPDDEFPPELARPAVRRYVRRVFSRLARRSGAGNVIEKTCANTLRVPFVDAILPEAVYLHLVRDGRDVTTSAMQRWTSKVDLPYMLKKARYMPPGDIPHYLLRFVRNRLGQRRSEEGRLSMWGPRFAGMEFYRDRPLAELCARQWQHSVDKARQDLAALPEARHLELRYEDFTAKPAVAMEAIGKFLDESWSEADIAAAVADVRISSVGNWRRKLSVADRALLATELGWNTLDDTDPS